MDAVRKWSYKIFETPTLISVIAGCSLVLWQQWTGSLPPSVQITFFTLFIFLTGIPHGAIDHLVEKETAKRQQKSSSQVPIASLTKLMTVLVFLEQKPDLAREVEVTPTELNGGGHTQLRHGEVVSLGDLLHMSLMCSDNVATRVLARESQLAPADFIARMNRKALELALRGVHGLGRAQRLNGRRRRAHAARRGARSAHPVDHDDARVRVPHGASSARHPQHGPPALRPLGRAGRQDGLHPGVGLLLRDVDPLAGPRPDRGGPGRPHERDPVRGRRAIDPEVRSDGGRGVLSRTLQPSGFSVRGCSSQGAASRLFHRFLVRDRAFCPEGLGFQQVNPCE